MPQQDSDAPVVRRISPEVVRLRAPNPGPMTAQGTNTYLVGGTQIAVIDPGPDSPAHLDRILEHTGDTTITAILVTHSHRDHSTLAPALSRATGAPVLGFGPSGAGRRPVMEQLGNGLGGGEGVDHGFRPDRCLQDGESVAVGDTVLTALWTPGHMSNHLCYALGDLLFSGDLIMGWSTSLVSPPDGDLTAFMASCARLSARKDRMYLPGHGAPVDQPARRVAEIVAHRSARTAQLRTALAAGGATVADLTRQVYGDIDEALIPAAQRNLLAHLIALIEVGEVSCNGEIGPETVYFSSAGCR